MVFSPAHNHGQLAERLERMKKQSEEKDKWKGRNHSSSLLSPSLIPARLIPYLYLPDPQSKMPCLVKHLEALCNVPSDLFMPDFQSSSLLDGHITHELLCCVVLCRTDGRLRFVSPVPRPSRCTVGVGSGHTRLCCTLLCNGCARPCCAVLCARSGVSFTGGWDGYRG